MLSLHETAVMYEFLDKVKVSLSAESYIRQLSLHCRDSSTEST